MRLICTLLNISKKYSKLYQLVENLSVIVTMMFTLLHHFEEQALIFVKLFA